MIVGAPVDTRATQLSRFCEGVLEAGWLAALVVASLFFNVNSARGFDPDKAALVRSVALVMTAAWIVTVLEEGLSATRARFESSDTLGFLRRVPLALPVAGLLAVYLLSTLFSVTPRVSFWGSYTRLQGTYTTLSYLMIFVAVATHLRRIEQVERIITTLMLASLSVSLYGVMQHFHADPLSWREDTVARITATMGNPIFVAAHVIMIVPLAVMRVVQSCRTLLTAETRSASNIARASLYTFIVAMQMLALRFSGSRGPWLGLLAGLLVGALLVSRYLLPKRVALATMGLAAVLALLLIGLNVPYRRLESLKHSVPLGRLPRAFEVNDSTSMVRVLLWKGAVAMFLSHPPLVFPDRHVDSLNAVRPLIGYGPESMDVASSSFYPPDLGRYEGRDSAPDRFHNETFDALLTTGLCGLVAYHILFAAVFYLGLTRVGANTPPDKWLFVGLYAGGGLLGAAGLVLWQGLAYFGVGLPSGILFGLLAYLTYVTFTRPAIQRELNQWNALVVIALLSALVAHFTEIQFGIATLPTRLLFWVYAGMLIAIGRVMPIVATPTKAADNSANTALRNPRKRSRPAPATATANPFAFAGPSLVTALMTTTMGFSVLGTAHNSPSIRELFVSSLTTLYATTHATSYGMLLLFGAIWLAAVVAWANDRRSAVIAAAGSLVVWLVFVYWHLDGASAIASAPPATSAPQLIQNVRLVTASYERFSIWLLSLIVLTALALVVEWPATRIRSGGTMVAAVLLFSLALVGDQLTNAKVIQADMAAKVGTSLENVHNWVPAIAAYDYAVALAPQEDQYALLLGRAYFGAANVSTDAAERVAFTKAAMDTLKSAQSLSPLSTTHSANVARALRLWAQATKDRTEAAARVTAADQAYATAVNLSPKNVQLWNEWASFTLIFRHDDTRALEQLTHSLSLDDAYPQTYTALADYWVQRARSTSDVTERRTDYEKAVAWYREALAQDWSSPAAGSPSSITSEQWHTRFGLASALETLGQTDGAIATYETVADLGAVNDNVWQVYHTLARLYLGKGDKTKALDYASRSLASAPDAYKPTVRSTIATIGR